MVEVEAAVRCGFAIEGVQARQDRVPENHSPASSQYLYTIVPGAAYSIEAAFQIAPYTVSQPHVPVRNICLLDLRFAQGGIGGSRALREKPEALSRVEQK